MDSKANFQQAPVHCSREITKAKLSQAKSFFIHIFLFNNCKRGRKGIFGQVWVGLSMFGHVWASLGKFGQVGTSWDKLRQVWTSLDKATN